MITNNRIKVGCVVGGLILLLIHVVDRKDVSEIKNYIYYNSNDDSILNSLSIFKDTNLCAELLDNMEEYQMTPTYKRLFPLLLQDKKKALTGSSEGDSNGAIADIVMLHQIARHPSVKTICETGFNYGHSSFNYLSANPNVHVYSFDLGVHAYAKKMNESLHRLFPDNRLHLTFGDSSITLPKAIESGFLPRCDFVFVDGGHNYRVAKADIKNFAMHMNPKGLMMFDNWPTKWGGDFGKAWDEVLLGDTLKKGQVIDYKKMKEETDRKGRQFAIKEMIRCKDTTFKLHRGYVLGTVVTVL